MRQTVRVEVAAIGAGVRVQGGAAEGAGHGAAGACHHGLGLGLSQ